MEIVNKLIWFTDHTIDFTNHMQSTCSLNYLIIFITVPYLLSRFSSVLETPQYTSQGMHGGGGGGGML